MFSTRPRIVISAFCFFLLLLLVVMPGVTPVSVPGSIASADPNIPRSYEEFIEGAYAGALGRSPTCLEAQAEYDALTSAAGGGVLHEEAQRFVSTLFETQASYDVNDGLTYCQTAEYEAINPASCNTTIGTGLDTFIADLYRAFLFREPDSSGFNYWFNNNGGRKHLINAFRDSIEFNTLVDHLFSGMRPTCQIECPECNPDPCEGPNQNGHYSKLCP